MGFLDNTILRSRNEPKGNRNLFPREKDARGQDVEMKASSSNTKQRDTANGETLPVVERNHNGHKVTKGIRPQGESGRSGIHPLHFLKICWRSSSRLCMYANVLWPFVPAAIAVRYSTENHLWIFILNYIAMVPCANLIGFAGQELARKMHNVIGVLLETTLGSIVEIVLFMVLVKNDQFLVIQAAILGSILATLLLCMGMCFFVGGMRHEEQEFASVVGEVGSNLLLTA